MKIPSLLITTFLLYVLFVVSIYQLPTLHFYIALATSTALGFCIRQIVMEKINEITNRLNSLCQDIQVEIARSKQLLEKENDELK